jgi:hypothetical protein
MDRLTDCATACGLKKRYTFYMSKQDRAATTPFLHEQQDGVGEPLLREQVGLAVGDHTFDEWRIGRRTCPCGIEFISDASGLTQ